MSWVGRTFPGWQPGNLTRYNQMWCGWVACKSDAHNLTEQRTIAHSSRMLLARYTRGLTCWIPTTCVINMATCTTHRNLATPRSLYLCTVYGSDRQNRISIYQFAARVRLYVVQFVAERCFDALLHRLVHYVFVSIVGTSEALHWSDAKHWSDAQSYAGSV